MQSYLVNITSVFADEMSEICILKTCLYYLLVPSEDLYEIYSYTAEIFNGI